MANRNAGGFDTNTGEFDNFDKAVAPVEGLTWETLPPDIIRINELHKLIQEVDLRDFVNQDGSFLLPHGLFVDGQRLNTFTLNPYKAGLDRALAEIIKRLGRKGFAAIVGNFFPAIIATIGGQNPTLLATKVGAMSVSDLFYRLTFADIVTILYRIRVNSCETYDIALSGNCPNCGTLNEDSKETGFHDIGSVPVKIVRNLTTNLEVAVKLNHGIDPGFGKVADIVYMRPVKMSQMTKIADTKRSEDIEMLYQMVSALPQIPEYHTRPGYVMGDELYDELSMSDQRILTDAVSTLQIGPVMTISNQCYVCGHEWDVAVGMGRLREFLFNPPSTAA